VCILINLKDDNRTATCLKESIARPLNVRSPYESQQTETVENSREIQALERTLKVMEDRLEDVKADRDEWRKQANQLLLSAPTARKKFLGIF
jgi:molecular chaperone GrpE (heat shock protein)